MLKSSNELNICCCLSLNGVFVCKDGTKLPAVAPLALNLLPTFQL